MADHDDLIARLEAAKEGSQATLLREALDFAHQSGWITFDQWERAKWWVEQGAFLDAALTLVPEGWGWAVAELDAGAPSAVVTNYEPQLKPNTLDPNPAKLDLRAKASTPALALCIPALKAQNSP